MEEKKDEGTGTLRKDKTLLRDEKKMEKLKQKLHTDDERKQNQRGPWKRRGGRAAIYSVFALSHGIYILMRKGRYEEVKAQTRGSTRAIWGWC